MRVSADPAVQMTDVQAKRYYDIAMDLHDMQRRAVRDGDGAQSAAHPQMTRARGQVVDRWPAAAKTQFDADEQGIRRPFA